MKEGWWNILRGAAALALLLAFAVPASAAEKCMGVDMFIDKVMSVANEKTGEPQIVVYKPDRLEAFKEFLRKNYPDTDVLVFQSDLMVAARFANDPVLAHIFFKDGCAVRVYYLPVKTFDDIFSKISWSFI